MILIALLAAFSFAVTFLAVPVLMRKFKDAGLTGKDVHKPGKPEIPEMGGLAVVAGLVAGVLVAIAAMTLAKHGMANIGFLSSGSLIDLFAALATILIIAIIGMFDGIVRLRHSIKAVLPLFASIPLVAVAAGHPYITLPVVGQLYLPVIYPLLLIPLAVTVVPNLTNMFAGFNGLEAGLGIIGCLSLGMVALSKGSLDAAVLLLCMVGALSAFIWFNKYPARIFIGDVGTLSIGACIVSAVIIGNFEMAGVIVMIPYLVDFVIKAKNKFPREIDFTSLKGGKLVASRSVGLPSLIMRKTGGISEVRLVMLLLGFETMCGAAAVLAF
jgi:UDP-N-acetylglucosamine--dolichyl-phosphate N-acetylglucosaminephosphotransferase